MGFLARSRHRAADALAAAHAAEGVRYAGVCGGWMTLSGFSAPGVRSSWARRSMRWTLLLTDERIRLHALSNRYPDPIDAAWDDAGTARLEISVDPRGRLRLAFRAEAFRLDCAGSVVAELRLPDAADAAAIAEGLRGRRTGRPPAGAPTR